LPKDDDSQEEFNITEKIAEIESSDKTNKEKVYSLLGIGSELNIQLVN
jgi:hypothetical protein